MEALDAILKSADILVGWALAIFGGSILTIISTSYSRPSQFGVRLLYLIFIPAWIALGCSMYHGNMIGRRVIAAKVNPNTVPDVFSSINADYMTQQNSLALGVALFALWLLIYLLWWVFNSSNR